MKKILASLICVGFFSASSFAAGDPSSLKLKIYSVYASLSAQCTSPIQIFNNTSGSFVDLLVKPVLGSGDLADGTYNCIIIKMSSIIKHTPLVTDTTCVAATEYTGGVCNVGDQATDLSNAAIGCMGNGTNAGSIDNTVYMYLTTDSLASTGNKAFVHPMTAGDGNGIKLSAPLIISSTSKAKFVVNATGKVVAGGGECGINPPAFGFVNY
jgi:hypothetical protein